MSLFSTTFQTIENGISYASQKQQTIAQNIANVDTPNYKSKTVSRTSEFRDLLHNELEAYQTDSKHIPFSDSSQRAITQQAITQQGNTSYQANGNNVDMDKEMADMAENQIYYEALVDRLNGKFNSLQTVIRGGK
ncbi:flagellar basal body rod protein FlgB [Priestia megaterium]|uniref:flagellar basal body rod protein FlgB n=1 Tax=Priestia TaxID=2800373 RepID=UPI0007C50271|nr:MULTISPECIES: flagellar basal body rod protein FlgB [Priestia]MBD8113072.1 flagellar basal body rod protein FlgB [Priestia megaterium]MBU8584957.1 flagellar basal body rod protein FlgB [Priestia megaterium]MCG0048579.1 flagellar basal body rod protein FlgB [Priestia aryabhattai]MCI4623634.1 flagellar basal body rod protein FlgB [Priestia megaterium]MDP1378985.1 flagellar basal body rod protein FlgB [Priestia megaterium]